MNARLVDGIYEAAFRPRMWESILAELALLARGAGAFLRAEHGGKVRWINTPGIESLVTAYASDGWDARNTRIARMSRLSAGWFSADHHLFTEAEMTNDPLYRDLLHPLGLGAAIATHLTLPGGHAITFSIERSSSAGPPPQGALSLFSRLRPHLARSALTSALLSFQDVTAGPDPLQRMEPPSALICASGRLLACNAAFAASMPALAREERERLRLSDPVADATFVAAAGALRRGMPPPHLSMPCRTGERATHVLHLVPVRGTAREHLMGAGAVAIFVPLTQGSVTKAEFLASMFDFTPMEASLTTLLADGTSPISLAHKAGLDQVSVRHHFEAVFTKTGTRDYVDFARLLMRLNAEPPRRSPGG